MMYANTNKLTIFALVSLPDGKPKRITLYTTYDMEDADDAREMLKIMRNRNQGLKLEGQVTSHWNID